ncbi:hypothetical protein ACI1TM_10690 [Lactococcus garvieae]|uniref:hypothetical protein n=1 Tax=Lactococcus garvieae TaxID=1363 RepID=UPI00385419B5
MKKILPITLLSTSFLAMAFLNKTNVKASEKSDKIVQISSTQSNIYSNAKNSSLKSILFQDSLKNGLSYWNIDGQVTSNTLGAFLAPYSSISLKYPIFLQEGESYPYKFSFMTTNPTHSITRGYFRISEIGGSEHHNLDFNLAADPSHGNASSMAQTFNVKKTGYYDISFITSSSNTNTMTIFDFSISQN